VLDTYGSENKIGNKLMGTIDKGPWEAVCKERFKYHPDGWEVKMTTIISEWETRMADQEYHPYKMVKLDEQGSKMKVNKAVNFFWYIETGVVFLIRDACLFKNANI
jgi:hypothetical protein